MNQLKKELEKNCFGHSFSEIKSHTLLKDLNLTEEEIINNWRLIKQTLDSHCKCGDSKKFCNSLDCHYFIKRNSDHKLILKEMICEKVKNYHEIPSKEINKKIKELLHISNFSFKKEEIPSCIKKLEIFKKPEINELIKNIGDPKYTIPSTYIKMDKGKKEICILYSYHLILSQKSMVIIDSNDLKDLCINNSYQFKNEETEKYSQRYQKLKNTLNLIILDWGLEHENMKQTYYLDLFPEFLNHRKDKLTYIISPVFMNIIIEELKNSKKVTSATIHQQKINKLKNIMESCFSVWT